MVTRIAPSPIDTSVAVGDGFPHAFDSGTPSRHRLPVFQPTAENPMRAPAAPLPPPPGEAFAAAVIAGQLPPRPTTVEQLRQRLGSAWAPPASPFRLMDKTA